MSLLKKLKLYDGQSVDGYQEKDARELQDEAEREGMDGISPRYVINRISGRSPAKGQRISRQLIPSARSATALTSTRASRKCSASTISISLAMRVRVRRDRQARSTARLRVRIRGERQDNLQQLPR
jgi:hypothetical protein